MLLEPPGPDLPRHAEPLASPLGTVRLIAGLSAAVVALSASGPIVGLVVLVALALTTVVGAGTAGLVGTALAWRWGTGSLAAVAGAQGVLGPGLVVGPPAAALSSMVAAIALVTATPGTGALDWASAGPALATGSAAAFVVAGMEGAPAVRVVCTVVGVAAALGVGRLPRRRERLVAAGGLAVVATLLAAVS